MKAIRKVNIPGCGEVEIIQERPVSMNPADNYLTYVMAYIPRQDEYVTWLYNNEAQGYNNGHYFSGPNAKKEAFNDYLKR
jgi:hypothetical protein